MKKILTVVCSLVLFFSAVSCKKDNPNGGNPSSDNNTAVPTYIEGVYNPGMHISSIMGPGRAQSWSWDNSNPKQLTSIRDVTNGSEYTFTYKGSGRWGVSSYTEDGVSHRLTYSYDDGTLDNFEVRQNDLLMTKAEVFYTAGHIGHISYGNLANKYLIQLVNKQYGLDLSTNSSIDLGHPSFTVNYEWNGNNVSSESIDVTLVGSMSLTDLYSLFESSFSNSGLGQYAGIIPLIIQYMGDSVYDFTITMNTESAYTYDNKNNPFHGFWAKGLLFNTQVLSANNVLTQTVIGALRFQSSIAISFPQECPDWMPSSIASMWPIIRGILNNMRIPIDRTFPLDKSNSFTYQYNAQGYPTSVTDQDQVRYEYSY